MSKTILLELTEKQFEVLSQGLIREKAFWEDADPSVWTKTLIDKKKETCNVAWSNLDSSKNERPDLLITAKDLFFIKSLAKSEFQNLRNDVHISNKKVEQEDFVHISLANALIMWLNSKHLLKSLAKFDFTDHSSEFEEMEE